ncbi:ACP S-malonyltransferase [Aurantiacibacter spongiae]|uniref:Malonyl CoA-acyl carrier protein transacylase n=1 Tax=Aurantiacibacter spongiae TaxID=2488860 RepID=A0A3N5CNR1_9SPHN|nr:ACP S-malonyltransferase [Aurantiacibacter spongiae]RPF70584.1 [acyl-carrier-protein] S-malonyltransferase [Aurantiacibacter spongiae]
MIGFVFPGQGSQKVGMGTELAEASNVARDVFAEVDDALSQKLGQLMAEGPESELTMTTNAQPAIMANSMAVVRVLEDGGVDIAQKGEAVAGHSLGEYSALASVGAFSLTDTAKLLRTRGIAMQDAVPIGLGAMCALLGADLEKAQALAEAAAEGQVCEVANDNDPGQVVLSGHMEAINRAVEMAKEFGVKKAVKLPVSAPFHCTLMQPAAQRMQFALNDTPPNAFRLPVYANVTARAVTDAATEKDLLIQQITGRVRWRESVLEMHQAGIDHFVELGGKVLGPMIRKIVPEVTVTSVVGMEDIETLAKDIG